MQTPTMIQNGKTNGVHTPASVPAAAAAPATFTEAPASLTVKINYRGYNDILFTLRDGTGLGLLAKLDVVLDKFDSMGITPSSKGATASSAAASGDAPMCPDGHGQMKPSKKGGGFYCPHVLGESAGKKLYCQHKV